MLRTTLSLALLTLFPLLMQAHDGPHGGELYCDGKHSHHAELCVDAKTGKATIYILDKKGKNEVPLTTKTISVKVKNVEPALEFKADKTKDGKSSQYVFTHPRFMSKLKPSDVKMEIVLVEGKPAVVFDPEHDDD
jgi:hypothetical protein